MTANDEALRIWTTLPVSQWKQAIEQLPERKAINGVTWQYRLAVRERLATGWRLRNSNAIWQGLDPRLLLDNPSGCSMIPPSLPAKDGTPRGHKSAAYR